ncbi:MAG: sigma-70 family RNA polymerase sigma factor [Planctomycetota bacterium]
MQRDELLHLLLDRRGAILGWIAVVLPDRTAGEDVFQETLIRANDACDKFDHPGHAMAWVRTTARNLALNEARRSHRRDRCLDDTTLAMLESEWSQHNPESGREDIEQLERCLDRLSPFARSLIRLRFADNLDGASIALRVGKTLGAVQVAYSRVYKALAQCMQGGVPGNPMLQRGSP